MENEGPKLQGWKCGTDGIFGKHFPLLPSSRHHLSYDGCLEIDKSENYHNCSVQCCLRQLYTMIGQYTHTYEQFLQLSVGLGFVFEHLFRFSILCIFLVLLRLFCSRVAVLLAFVVLDLVFSVLRQEIG